MRLLAMTIASLLLAASSFAQTTNTSAIGLLVIHIFEPVSA